MHVILLSKIHLSGLDFMALLLPVGKTNTRHRGGVIHSLSGSVKYMDEETGFLRWLAGGAPCHAKYTMRNRVQVGD